MVRHARGARVTVVLRADLPAGADPTWPRTVVAKAYRADEGAATHAAMTALWASPLATSPAVVVARPLGYDPALGVLLQSAVPDERTLTALVVAAVGDGSPAALDRLGAALRRTADGLVALHASGVEAGPVRTPDVLVGRVRRAARRLGAVLPDGAATVEALLAPLAAAAARHPAGPPVPSHGGFRPAQVLLDVDDRPGFIDFDGFCRAEPAFDLGRFRARLREIALAAPGGRDPALSPGRRRLVDDLADVVLDHYLTAGTGRPAAVRAGLPVRDSGAGRAVGAARARDRPRADLDPRAADPDAPARGPPGRRPAVVLTPAAAASGTQLIALAVPATCAIVRSHTAEWSATSRSRSSSSSRSVSVMTA